MFSIPAMWEAIQLWQGWKRIGAGLKWLLAHPMAALALALGIWGVIEHRGAAKWEAQALKVARTLSDERKASQTAKLAYEAKSRKDAQDADNNHTSLAAGGADRFGAYVAGHGVRQDTAHRAGGAADHDPAIPESPTSDAIMAEISRVWITRSDWLTCDADWAYAQAAHDWGKRLEGDQPN